MLSRIVHDFFLDKDFLCGPVPFSYGLLCVALVVEQMLWNRWAEEWVILYDDSTMAWFTEPGRSSPSGKILVKEAPEMLAIAHWTGQIPRRPPLPDGVSVSQLIALGSRRKRSKVYWMLAKSEQEVSDWIDAITKTLPPPPQIELVVDKPHLMNVLRRPLVRIRREYQTLSFTESVLHYVSFPF